MKPITSSKVMAILLNGWILPIGGVASGMAACAAGLFLWHLKCITCSVALPLTQKGLKIEEEGVS